MKSKIAILVGAALSFSAYAENQTITIADDVSNKLCGSEPSKCILGGSGNTITVNSDLYNTIIAGSASNTDDGTINAINNTVIIGGHIEKPSGDIRGTIVSVENSNNDVNASGNINVINDAMVTTNLYGASVNVEKRFDDNITSDQTINLSGSINFGEQGDDPDVYGRPGMGIIVVGSDLSYRDSNGAGSVKVTQDGLVNIGYSELFDINVIGANVDFNTIDITPISLSTEPVSKIFDSEGIVNIRNSIIYNDDLITGTLISGSYANHDHTEINTKGTINVTGGEIVRFNIHGVTVNLASVTPESDDSDITVNATGNINIGGYAHFAGEIAAVNEMTNDINVIRNYQGNVTIVGDATASIGSRTNIYGVKIDDTTFRNFNYISNNTFSAIGTAYFEADSLNNFGHYSFTINEENYDQLADVDYRSAVRVGEFIGNDAYTKDGELVKTTSSVSITGISGDVDTDVINGTFFNLITLEDGAVAGFKVVGDDGKVTTEEATLNEVFNLVNENTKVGVGLVREAGITYDIVDDGKTIRATIGDVIVDDEKVDDTLKALSGGRLAALKNVIGGADTLSNIITGDHKEVGTFTPIAVIDGGKNRYSDDIKINSTDYRFLVGSRYQFTDNLFAGITFERGQSNYTAREHGHSGSGHSYNYGVNLFTKFSQFVNGNEYYLDGALGYGRTSTTYHSDDLITGGGTAAKYKSKVNYYRAQLGAGYVRNYNNVSFDTSVHYLYTHLGHDGFTIEGDNVKFNSLDSTRLRAKEKVSYRPTTDVTLSVAGIYEYEFESEANGSIAGVSGSADSLKGSTGGLEFGISSTPFASKDINLDFTVTGYVGQRKGVTGAIVAKYDF